MQPQNPLDPNQQPQPQAASPFMVQPEAQQPAEDPGKTLSLIGLIVAIFIPIVGIPLAAVGRSKSKTAGYDGKLGLIGIFVGIASIVLTLVFAIVLPLMMASSIDDAVKSSTESSLNSNEADATDDMSDSSTDTSSDSSSSSTTPDTMELGECMEQKGVDPNDLDAYIAASKECQAQTQ